MLTSTVGVQLTRPGVMLLLVVLPMIAEARLSRRHEVRLRAEGAIEPEGDAYRAMSLAYPAAFLAIIAEGALGGPVPMTWFLVGCSLFVASKALKYWAIRALSWRWCFRVLVPPDGVLVRSGPYRYLRHPNYVAVLGEIAASAVAMTAPLSGSVAVLGFAGLIAWRIRIERAALGD